MQRTVWKGTAIALCLVALAGCRDNEESVYIEHMKAVPEAPECSYSAGDGETPGFFVDLAWAQAYYPWFLVTNGMMTRKNYNHLKAESNGFFLDGADTMVSIPGGGSSGPSTDNLAGYLAPKTSDVLPATLISEAGMDSLRESLGCYDVHDDAFLAGLSTAIINGTVSSYVFSEYYEPGVATVRMYGHTQGGIDLETNEFSIVVDSCCGCSIDWSDCATPCVFCSSAPSDEDSYCFPGVGGGSISCRDLVSPSEAWCEEYCVETDTDL